MALEQGTALYNLVSSNPAQTDAVSDGYAHLRLIKSVLLSTFAGFTSSANAVLASTPNQIDAACAAVSGGTALVGAGTAAAPALGVGTATNGLYAPAANQVAIATNGTPAVTVDASGDVTVTGNLTVNGHLYGDGSCPIGSGAIWFTATPPTGWLLCNGQSCAAYPALVAAIGSNAVPNMVSCVPAYADGSNFYLGNRNGAINVGVPLPYHTHGATATDYGHTHPFQYTEPPIVATASGGSAGPYGMVNPSSAKNGTTGVGNANIAVSVQPAGTSGAVINVTQPSFGVYFIIRAF